MLTGNIILVTAVPLVLVKYLLQHPQVYICEVDEAQ